MQMKFNSEKILNTTTSSERRKRPPPPITLPPAKIYAPIIPFRAKSVSLAESRSLELADRTNCNPSDGNFISKTMVDESKLFEFEEHRQESEEENEDEDRAERKSEKGCRCGRTKCLKQYCACFRTDQRCTADCVCQDCRNDGHHEVERMLAIRHVRMHSNTAFKGTKLAANDQQVITPRGSVRILRGCRCKKSRCQKKYCECFGVGLACTPSCVCIDCINGNESSQQYEILASMQSKSDSSGVSATGLNIETSESAQQNSSEESDTSEGGSSESEEGENSVLRGPEEGETDVSFTSGLETDTKDEAQIAEHEVSAEAAKSEEEVSPDDGLDMSQADSGGGIDRKPTPVQSRTGWENDEGMEGSTFDAQLILGPPTCSPRSKLRWASFGDTSTIFSPRSPAGSQREVSAFRPCTAQPCSPMGDVGLPWDVGLQAAYSFE